MSDLGWTGELQGEYRTVEYSEWYWGDSQCKTRCRDKYTFRKFVVTPPAPKNGELRFMVKPTWDSEPILCYSNGEDLIAVEPITETETRYITSFWDRLRALFLK